MNDVTTVSALSVGSLGLLMAVLLAILTVTLLMFGYRAGYRRSTRPAIAAGDIRELVQIERQRATLSEQSAPYALAVKQTPIPAPAALNAWNALDGTRQPTKQELGRAKYGALASSSLDAKWNLDEAIASNRKLRN
jgi:hypothetical protein